MNYHILLHSAPVMFPIEMEKDIVNLRVETPVPFTMFDMLNAMNCMDEQRQMETDLGGRPLNRSGRQEGRL